MATEVFVTIQPSGGDYTSLSACEAGENKDWVTADQFGTWEVQGDWSSSSDTTKCNINGGITDATRTITIQANTANRVDTSAYDANKYEGPEIDSKDENTFIVGIQVLQVLTLRGNDTADSVWVRNSTISFGIWFRDTGVSDSFAYNCVVELSGSTSSCITADHDGRVWHCTVLAGTTNAIVNNLGTIDARNNIVQGAAGDDYSGTFAAASDNNCSADATAPGSNSITSATVSFSSGAQVSSGDTTGVIGGGQDLTATVPVDMDGTTRATASTMGAYEVVSGTNISPSLRASTTTLPSPSLGLNLAMGTRASTTALPSPAVELNIEPAVRASTTTLPNPTLSSGQQIIVDLLASTTTLPSPSVELNILLSLLASSTTLPSPTVDQDGFVNLATYDSNGATEQTVHSVTMPSGQIEGNALIILIAIGGPGGMVTGTPETLTVPTGWEELPDNPVDEVLAVGGSEVRARVLHRLIPGGGVGSTVDFTLSGNDLLNATTIQVSENTIVSDGYGTGSSTSPSSPSVAFGTPVYVLRWLISDDQSATAPTVYPTSHNQRSLLESDDSTIAVADTLDSTTPTGAATWTLDTSENWAAGTITLATLQTVRPELRASTTTLPSPSLGLNLEPAVRASTTALASPTVELNIALALLASTTALPDPSVVNTGATISLATRASTTTLPNPTVLLTQLILLSLRSSTTTLPSFTLTLDGSVSFGESGADMGVSFGVSGADIGVTFGQSGADL